MDYSLAYQSMNAIILLQFFCENSSTFLRQSRCCFLDDHLQLWVLITRILEIQETVSNLHRKNVTHFPVWRSSFCCPEFPGKQRAAQSPSSSTATCVFLSCRTFIHSHFYGINVTIFAPKWMYSQSKARFFIKCMTLYFG